MKTLTLTYQAQVWTGDNWQVLGTYRTAGYARRRLGIWDRHEGRKSRWRCQETRIVEFLGLHPRAHNPVKREEHTSHRRKKT